jgi:IS30 family transposase
MKQYHHLTIHEREQIKLLLSQGKSLGRIAKDTGRDKRTISRELERNSSALGRGSYCPTIAQQQAAKRRGQSKTRKLASGALHTYVVDKLTRGWSPEAIAGRLAEINSQVTVSYEVIYQFVYDQSNRSQRYWEFLHRGHKRRQHWYDRKSQSVKKLVIPNKTNIALRPDEANQRATLGHLEGDLMEGARKTGGAVSVTADRRSGFVFLDKLMSKQSKERIETLVRKLKKYPPALRKTITFDNGTENFEHEQLISELGCQTYFCNPYHSWEKGTVENTIGLIRSWVPKGSDLTTITQSDLNVITYELNNRPRKRLGFLTPAEVVLQEANWGT